MHFNNSAMQTVRKVRRRKSDISCVSTDAAIAASKMQMVGSNSVPRHTPLNMTWPRHQSSRRWIHNVLKSLLECGKSPKSPMEMMTNFQRQMRNAQTATRFHDSGELAHVVWLLRADPWSWRLLCIQARRVVLKAFLALLFVR